MTDGYQPKGGAGYIKTFHDTVPSAIRLKAQDFFGRELPPVKTGKGVKVCVLGGGVGDHPCLKTTVNGVNMGPSEHTADIKGHATVSGGIIAGNDESFVGIAPEVTLYFAKVTDDSNKAVPTAVAAGLVWAAVVGANVVVLTHPVTSDDSLVVQAVEKAVNANAVIVVDDTVEGAIVPHGAVGTKGMRIPDGNLIVPHVEGAYAEVAAADFSAPVLGAVAALYFEAAKAKEKRPKGAKVTKALKELLSAQQG